MNAIFKGNLKLEIDEAGLEARLYLAPDSEGAEWTKDKILTLLNNKKITEGVDLKGLNDFFSQGENLFPKETGAREPLTLIIARGTAPEDSEPARLRIDNLSITPDLQKDADRVINKNRAPLIYERIFENVKVERIIEKKPKLPFLAAKKVKEVKWKKKQILRPVRVAPGEKGRGYVKEGTRAARIVPVKRGRNGLNIFGEEIPAKTVAEAGIYLSEGLKEYGVEITAEKTGFFRYGENWIELFPYTRLEYSVYQDENGLCVWLDFYPGESAPIAPVLNAILEECRKLDVDPETLLNEDGIKQLLADSVSNKTPLEKQSLSLKLDAEIHINISEDKLKALLFLKKGRGSGKELSIREIGDVIRTKRLRGIDAGKLKKDLLDFIQGAELSLKDYLLVEGRNPTVGEDGSIKWLADFLNKEEVSEVKQQIHGRLDQLIDLRSLDEFPISEIEDLALVKERSKIASVEPPTAGEAGFDVHGSVLPGQKGKEPRLKIYENVQLLKNDVVALCEGILAKGTKGETVILRVHPHKNSKIKVEVSEDHMKAFLTLLPSVGTGSPLLPEDVNKEIKNTGIVRGLKESVLKEAIENAKAGERVENVLIAQGMPMEHGKRGELLFHIARASGKSVTITREGRADYRIQDKITSVQKDTLLAEFPSPAGRQDGWDITGKTLSAKDEAPVDIQTGKNVERREESDGSIKFYSRISGELLFDGRYMEVLNIHSIDGDVGLRTGNIKFSGSVRVKGSIHSGFSVLSGESIIIDETVQGALLSAEQNIFAQKGVKGEGRAILRAKKNIKSYFAEQAILLSVEDIHMKNASLRCQIKCNGRLFMESDKGHIVGGRVQCKSGLEAMNLGSERGIKTEIHFGQDYLVGDQIELEQKEIEKLNKKINELNFSLNRLDRALHPDHAALEKIRHEKLYNMRIMEKRTRRLFNLREKFEKHFPSEIIVKGTAFPGVVLESHGRRYEIKDKKNKTVFLFNPVSGRIEEKPMDRK